VNKVARDGVEVLGFTFKYLASEPGEEKERADCGNHAEHE
jgi:hypothetical protein